MNVLVTGANGFLGLNVIKISNNSFNFIGATKSNLNLYSMSDILNKINNLNNYKSEIIVKNEGLTLSYTGDSNKLEKLNLSFKGINYFYNYFLK